MFDETANFWVHIESICSKFWVDINYNIDAFTCTTRPASSTAEVIHDSNDISGWRLKFLPILLAVFPKFDKGKLESNGTDRSTLLFQETQMPSMAIV